MKIKKINKIQEQSVLTIEELFEKYLKYKNSFIDERGNEVLDLMEFNIFVENIGNNNNVVFDKINYLIRHKIDKNLYTIKDLMFGNEITITADHSLIVRRDGVHISSSVLNLQKDDEIIINSNNSIINTTEFEISTFGKTEKPVYDISVSPIKENGEYYDNLCSFFGNNILIHNSNYCTFQEVRDAIGWKGSARDLILTIYNKRLKKLLEDAYVKFIDELNGMGYYLNFELETISNNGIWLAKSKYLLNLAWQDGVDIPNLSKLKFTGVEIIQSSTPLFARQNLKELVKYIFSFPRISDEHFPELTEKLIGLKKSFKLANIENVCKNNKINNYKKFVIDDKEDVIVRDGCPIYIRAAAIHNHLLYKNGLLNKYNKIMESDSVKWYYTKDSKFDVFGFVNGNYPKEIALPIDYNLQFEKVIINPINRIINPIGLPELNTNLNYTNSLF